MWRLLILSVAVLGCHGEPDARVAVAPTRSKPAAPTPQPAQTVVQVQPIPASRPEPFTAAELQDLPGTLTESVALALTTIARPDPAGTREQARQLVQVATGDAPEPALQTIRELIDQHPHKFTSKHGPYLDYLLDAHRERVRKADASRAAAREDAERRIAASLAAEREAAQQRAETASRMARQEARQHLLNNIALTYDQVRDRLTMKADLGKIILGRNHIVELTAVVFYSGKTRYKQSRPLLWFHSNSSDGWQYLDYHPITLLLEPEQRLNYAPDHDGDVGSGYVLEDMWINPTPADFAALIASHTVTGAIGISKFRLSPGQLELLRLFADCMADPAIELRLTQE